ncbi:hypothetical protein WN55_03489 [Dufourea novaeangliae]|uniref:Uncharacterized protein n=1 Tax=Dufourea novaeangliae TaxID=178035 RepID=A0A154PKI7_DUFNO|nr:hypothetical protein WN55_03489 [Dufourea novaeangliae]
MHATKPSAKIKTQQSFIQFVRHTFGSKHRRPSFRFLGSIAIFSSARRRLNDLRGALNDLDHDTPGDLEQTEQRCSVINDQGLIS